MRRIERSCSVKKKCEALAAIDQVGIKDASRSLNIARGTLHDWTKQAEAIHGFTGNATSKTLKGQGHKEIFPCISEVLTYMKDVRRLEQAKYEAFGGGGVLNVDETAVLFDMSPIKSPYDGSFDRIELPILFIIRGVPGGRLEQGELEEYPEGYFYTVQEKLG
ncbi:hypothetical protein ON010_g4166 [Phytophthora cinnamomi]|nr:hypothetical protein ON010_g4166 [Phytophthora cinnamomi]